MNPQTALSEVGFEIPDELAAIAAGGAPQSAAQLQQAFHLFNDASARFCEHFARLEDRVAELNLELEEANGELRRNLDEKQRMQDYLSTLLESLPLGVMGVGSTGSVTSMNRQASAILNRMPDEALDITDLFGSTGHVRTLTRAIEAGTATRRAFEVAYDRPGGERRRLLRVQVVPAAGRDEGEAVAVLLIEDVTEVKRLEEQANRNQRLAAMGEIAMNVAHEIRNPLGSIELFASMLQRELAVDPVNGPLASHICTGVRCVDHIVANILQFAQPQRLNCSSFDLQELLDEALLFAEHAIRGKRIRVERQYAPHGVPVWADADLLKQMFLNLLLNAVQATPEEGMIGVSSIPNGKSVEVQVWDTGVGLTPDKVARIFDPFFTTRRKGTGLGLTIAHNIVSVHQGSIVADNRPGGGALFSVVLPKRVPSGLDGAPIRSPLSNMDA